MILNQNTVIKKLISLTLNHLSHNSMYQSVIDHGPITVNAFSITFWIDYQGSAGKSSVYVKIPKYIFYNQDIDFLSPITKFDRELAKNEINSLEILSKDWNKSHKVCFVNKLAYIEEYNAILTERVYGNFLFEEFRESNLKKKYKAPRNDQTMIALYNFGKSLSSYHNKSLTNSIFKTHQFINKFNYYAIFLKDSGVSSKYLSNFLEVFLQYTNDEYHTKTTNNLKGIDIRQIINTDGQNLCVIDPGKISKGCFEIDLARFIVTCRILYWGSFKVFFRKIPNQLYEERFLQGYYGENINLSKVLNILIIKEFFKQWQVVHSALSRRNWPFFIKYFIKKLYIDPFYKWQIARGLSELIKSN